MSSEHAVPSALATEARNTWKRWLGAHDFQERPTQWEMIEKVLFTLVERERLQSGGIGVPFAAIEAPTGTGKTIAYLIAALSMAKHLECKVVVATSTVGLQAQIINNELPSLLEHGGMSFTYAMAKGRRRYLCLKHAKDQVGTADGASKQEALYPNETEDALSSQRKNLLESMLEQVRDDAWDGDLDRWDGARIDREDIRAITVDSHQCQKWQCPEYKQCCYYKARHKVNDAECVVTNHALVLSDMNLGGGVLLPPLENSIYIFDEAHHLNERSCSAAKHRLELRTEVRWMKDLSAASAKLEQVLDEADLSQSERPVYLQVEEDLGLLREIHNDLLDNFFAQSETMPVYDATATNKGYYLFEIDSMPPGLRSLTEDARTCCHSLLRSVEKTYQWLSRQLEGRSGVLDANQLTSWRIRLGACVQSLSDEMSLWDAYCQEHYDSAPCARWFTPQAGRNERVCEVYARPVIAANILQPLWTSGAAAILTSATLRTTDSFDTLKQQVGLPEGSGAYSIGSVFDYHKAAELVVPDLGCTPQQQTEHNRAVAHYLNDALYEKGGSLVLFSSRTQMDSVVEQLEPKLRATVLVQDEATPVELLRRHCQRVDKTGRSALFGMARFSEGIDLPGDYCTQVIIAKLNFPVPSTPIMRALGDWYNTRGESAFSRVSLPEATLRLSQCCGRLLRKESDTGRIVLLDGRIKSKPYGRTILKALPPFRQVIG